MSGQMFPCQPLWGTNAWSRGTPERRMLLVLRLTREPPECTECTE